MQFHQRILLQLLAKQLFGTAFQADEEIDWSAVFLEAKQQAVALLVYGAASKALRGVGKHSVANLWHSRAMQELSKNTQNFTAHQNIHNLMGEAGIPYTVLKGRASAFYYPDQILRSTGDVDFLVPLCHIDRVVQILKQNGFAMTVERHHFHYCFQKDGMDYELHREVPGMPSGEIGESLREFLSTMSYESIVIQDKFGTFRKPKDFHHGIVILLHTYEHMLASGIGLRHLCDLAVFFNHFSNESFLATFEKPLSEVGMWRFAQVLGGMCHRYLGLSYRAWMGEIEEQLCAALMEDIFAGGNFGRKDSRRIDQGWVIGDNNGPGSSKFGQLLKAYDARTKVYFPFSTHILLRPVGYIAMGWKYLRDVRMGKRKMVKLNGYFAAAEERKQLYARRKRQI